MFNIKDLSQEGVAFQKPRQKTCSKGSIWSVLNAPSFSHEEKSVRVLMG